MLRRFLLASVLVLALAPTPSQAVTIMKGVGHGDCYVVISDGRAVVVDAGPSSSRNGLVSLLKSGQLRFDRIVITHLHADHFGGLATAENYARKVGTKLTLTPDMLVSNRGAHDLNMIAGEATVSEVRAAFGPRVVGMTNVALEKLAFADAHLEIKGISLGPAGEGSTENKSGLVVKVTEIREGRRIATLFLGDIEQAQQTALFESADAAAIFKDVRFVTIPHHGRKTTLLADFFPRLKSAVPDVITLHSDSERLAPEVASAAATAQVKVISTADPQAAAAVGDPQVNVVRATPDSHDFLLNGFGEKAFHKVGEKPTPLREIVKGEQAALSGATRYTLDELVEAVAEYSGHSADARVPAGKVITIPSPRWIARAVVKIRQAKFTRESDAKIRELSSKTPKVRLEAEGWLAGRTAKLTSNQVRDINRIIPGAIDERTRHFAREFERDIRGMLRRRAIVEKHSNINDSKLFLKSGGRTQYVIKDVDDGLWRVYLPGRSSGIGGASYGSPVGTMRRPGGVNVRDTEVCEYCGGSAVGWCHIREKYVCSNHQVFRYGAGLMRCPP